MKNFKLNTERNDSRFNLLTKKLDLLINTFQNNIYIISNPVIHIPRNHPEYLTQWKPILYKSHINIKDFYQIIIKFFAETLICFMFIVKEILYQRNIFKLTESSPTKIDYLFISHYLGNETTQYDFYFGRLIEDLNNLNKSVVRVLIPHADLQNATYKSNSYKTFFLNEVLPIKTVIEYIINNIISMVKVLFFCISNKFNLYEIIVILYGQLNNFSNIKILFNLELQFKRLKPKKVVITFEGNAIERLVFLICRKFDIHSFGYQHAPIIKSQYSIFRSLGKMLDPNVILASGPYTFNKFMVQFKKQIPILCVGSPKYKDTVKNVFKEKNYRNILLVPDGNIASVDEFFELAKKIASKKNLSNITIRVHPLLVKHALNRISKFGSNYKNCINLSNVTLTSDLKWAYWVVYQNSSVAIEALFENCEVIYLNHNLSNINPLFDLSPLNYCANNFDEIINLISKKSVRSNHELMKLQKFAQNYFSKLDVNSLVSFCYDNNR